MIAKSDILQHQQDRTAIIGEHTVFTLLTQSSYDVEMLKKDTKFHDMIARHPSDPGREIRIDAKATDNYRSKNPTWSFPRLTTGKILSGDNNYVIPVAISRDFSQQSFTKLECAIPGCGETHMYDGSVYPMPRRYAQAAAWIVHMDWSSNPDLPEKNRSSSLASSNVRLYPDHWPSMVSPFAGFRNRLDLLTVPENKYPILFPALMWELALQNRISLPLDLIRIFYPDAELIPGKPLKQREIA